MATKKDTPLEEQTDRVRPGAGLFMARYYVELARFSTWLLTSVIIAVAFLLLGGLHSPKTPLLVSMYVAEGAFTLSLLCYVASGFLDTRLLSASDSLEKPQRDMLLMQLKVARISQQVLFAVGVIAVLVFAIEVSLLFFAAAPATAQPTAG
jgi:hypothetical protein